MVVTSQQITHILTEVVNRFLIPRFNELGMNASGEWLENLNIESRDNYGEIQGRDYSEQLAYGRRPGTMPPIEPIVQWAGYKLGLYGQEAKSAAFAIAKTMEQRGTTWYQRGGTDLISLLSSDEVVNYIHTQISSVMAVNVTREFNNRLQQTFS